MGFFDQEYRLKQLMNYFDFFHADKQTKAEEGKAFFWCVCDKTCPNFWDFLQDLLDSVMYLVKSNIA